MLLLVAGAGAANFFDGVAGWRGNGGLHTAMEVTATVLALVVGVLALARFYAKRAQLFLLIGTGFIGAGMLDLLHLIQTFGLVTSDVPAGTAEQGSWSWVAARQYLPFMLLLSGLSWSYKQNNNRELGGSAASVYMLSLAYFLVSFVFFAFLPLPTAYYPEIFFHRPAMFVPASVLLLAAIVFLRKGHWRDDIVEHWLVVAIILNFMGQAGYMSHSGALFDYQYDVAHGLKILSYLCVMAGLIYSMHSIFVTEHVASQRLADAYTNLTELQRRTAAIVDGVGEGIVTIDRTGIIQTVNPALSDSFGYDKGELVGQSIGLLILPEARAAHERYLEEPELHEKAIINNRRDLYARRKDASRFPVELNITKIQVKDQTHYLGLLIDISQRVADKNALKDSNETLQRALRELEYARQTVEQQAMEAVHLAEDKAVENIDLSKKAAETAKQSEQAEYEANHDQLTALLNRRGLEGSAGRLFADCAARKGSLALLFLDLDGFKTVNDTLGHDIGDFVLQKISAGLAAEMRPTDLIARVGGDEFVVLLTGNMSEYFATAVAERILKIPGAIELAGGQTNELGFSIGLAFYPRHAGGLDDLIKCADKAMYEAKNSGRNRVQVFAS